MPQSSITEAVDPAPDGPPSRRARGFRARVVDGLAFSTGLPAAIAAGLSLAASQALEAATPERWAALAASGTIVVYGLDRLRDTTRDRETSPLRTDFVERHALALQIAVAVAAVILGITLLASPIRVMLLCLAVGAIGLLHRRLKGFAALKTAYVSGAWVAICAGIPGIIALGASTESSTGLRIRFAWLAVIFFAAFTANLAASNLRDDETPLLRGRPESVIRIARALAILGVLLSWAAPHELLPLGWVPLLEALALAFFRPSEHYAYLAVDGALLVGALASLLHFALV